MSIELPSRAISGLARMPFCQGLTVSILAMGSINEHPHIPIIKEVRRILNNEERIKHTASRGILKYCYAFTVAVSSY